MAAVGGAFVLGTGALVTLSYAGTNALGAILPSAWGVALGVSGILTGVAILACVTAIHLRPDRHLVGGALLLILSIISVITATGGLVVGFVLTLVGGLWLFVWSPPATNVAAGPIPPRPSA